MSLIVGNGDTSGSAAAGNPDEEQPLLGLRAPEAPHSPWRRRMTVDVDRTRADVVLLLCYVITGLLDSSSISIWGSFVSMQTGSHQSPRFFSGILH
jgi:hypothetical protein